ncbi:P-loop containing nucleoside triphosphate hydrolase protein [Lipomyces arxii]|uniref:P-loop containing nucleoside triphosphate hydrolase protein n=1 Tax=Lipomyces arxii TaxID=56418 RepID=UPI0034CE4A4D
MSRVSKSEASSLGLAEESSDQSVSYNSRDPAIACLFSDVKPSYLSLFRFSKSTDACACLFLFILPAICGCLASAMSVFLGRIINCFSKYMVAKAVNDPSYNLAHATLPFLIGMLAVGAANMTVWYMLTIVSHWFAELQLGRARKMVLESLMGKENAWYDSLESPGALVTLTEKFFDEFETALSSEFPFYMFAVWKLLSSLGIALYFSWKLSLVIIATFPLIAGVQILISRHLTGYKQSEQKMTSQMMSIVDWVVVSLQTVKLFNAQVIEVAKFSRFAEQSSNYRLKIARLEAIEQALVRFLVLLLFLEAFWYGGHLVKINDLSSGGVLTVFWSCNTLSHSLASISPRKISIEKAKVAAQSLWILAGNRNLNQKECGLAVDECQADIEFTNVTFAYPSRPQDIILKDLTLKIPAKQLVFFVGSSGSGKSTIHQLLLNLYQPQSGNVALGGANVNFLLPSWLRRQVTVVQQDSVLFKDTIAENIKLGAAEPEKVNDEDIKRAVRFSMLAETVNDLPDGIDTYLSQGGTDLSGGQRQRIALARAVVRDSPILVLDEATSSLDLISRALIVDAVRVWRKHKTTIIITHDIAQIHADDNVVVMKEGRLVSQGTRRDLELNNDAPFMGLVNSLKKFAQSDLTNRRSLRAQINEFRKSMIEVPRSSYHPDFESRRATRISYFGNRAEYSMVFDINQPRWLLTDLTSNVYATQRHSSFQLDRPSTSIYADDSIIGDNAAIAAGNKVYMSRRRNPISRSRPTRNISDISVRKLSVISSEYSVEFEKNAVVVKDSTADAGVFKFLWFCFRSQSRKWVVVCGLIAAVLNGVALPLFSYTFVQLLYSILPTAKPDVSKWDSIKWPLAVLGVSIIDMASLFGHLYILDYAADQWVCIMRKAAIRKLLSRDWVWFIEQPIEDGIPSFNFRTPAALTQIVVTGAENARVVIGGFAGKCTATGVLFVGGLIAGVAVGWQLAFVTISVVLVPVAAAKFFNWSEAKWSKLYVQEVKLVDSVLYECIVKIRTIKTLGIEPYFREKHSAASRAVTSMGLKRGFNFGAAVGINKIGDSVVLTVMFYYGSVLIANGSYTILQFLTVANLIAFAFGSAVAAIDYMPNITKVIDDGVRLLELARLDGKSSRNEDSGKGNVPEHKLSGDIRFENVEYSYPGRDIRILHGVTLSVSSGEVVAIAGSSGCGKSTLANMITRLLVPTSGAVKIGGADIMGVDVEYLRSNIAVVSQSGVLFDGSIFENLVYGLVREVSREDVQRACTDAGIHDFISSLSEGYDTLITSTSSVSGGQAQRLTIARALLRLPSILILDECTSALDATSADQIRMAVRRLKNSKSRPTVVIVSHSRDMMECADRVVVMDAGRVVEVGEFEDLMRIKKGHLANLISGGQWE